MIMLNLILAILLISIEKTLAFTPSQNNVLVLTRSNNSNAVYYDANMIKEKFNTKNPLNIYWVLHEKNDKVADLNNVEKEKAYGVSIKKATPTKVSFSLKARPTHTITMRLKNKGELVVPYATLVLNNEKIEIQRVHLNVNVGTIVPTVKSIEYYGFLKATGEKIKKVEQIKN